MVLLLMLSKLTLSVGWEDKQADIPYKVFVLKDESGVKHNVEYQYFEKLFNAHLHGNNWEISRLYAIENPLLKRRFEDEFRVIESRIKTSPALFKQQSWQKLNKSIDRQWMIQNLQDYCNEFSHNSNNLVNVTLGIHGASEAAAWSVCCNGFAALALVDDGYFGRGIYLTRYTDYAAGVYSKPNPQGERVLLVSWSLIGNTFPVTESPFEPQSYKGANSFNMKILIMFQENLWCQDTIHIIQLLSPLPISQQNLFIFLVYK